LFFEGAKNIKNPFYPACLIGIIRQAGSPCNHLPAGGEKGQLGTLPGGHGRQFLKKIPV
jgi:hypothetical protein